MAVNLYSFIPIFAKAKWLTKNAAKVAIKSRKPNQLLQMEMEQVRNIYILTGSGTFLSLLLTEANDLSQK